MRRAFLICLAAALALALLAGCGAMEQMLGEVAAQESYDLGADRLSSVKAVVGMREVTGFEKRVGTVTEQTYSYKSDSVTEDLIAYVSYLSGEGYLCTEGGEFDSFPGDVQFACESLEEGKIIAVDIEWEQDGYTLTIKKYAGELTRY